MTPYYQDEAVCIYHGDCQEILPQLTGKTIHLVLTDPPYGTQTRVDNARFCGGTKTGRTRGKHLLQERVAVIGDTQPFDPSALLLFSRVVLWGANHYASRLPDSGGWIVWDKRHGVEDVSWPLSEAELAWTNLSQGIRVFRHRWMGLVRETDQGEHYHPTQKPVALMRWILERWTQPGHTILDPFMGSGTTLRAAKDCGRQAIGIEIEERYCEIAVKRLRQESFNFAPFLGRTTTIPAQIGLYDE